MSSQTVQATICVQALTNQWLADHLDTWIEAGSTFTDADLLSLIRTFEPLPDLEPGQIEIQQNAINCLYMVARYVRQWLSEQDAGGRPLTAAELKLLVTDVIAHLPGALTRLAVHSPSDAGRYVLPLWEGEHLTLALNTWDYGLYTSLHDHGSSSGAIAILSGMLSEEAWAPGWDVTFVRTAETAYAFAPEWIHRMGNPWTDQAAPISVHAYSGPAGGLTAMVKYQFTINGQIEPIESWTKGGRG